jgi:hypothetical protein
MGDPSVIHTIYLRLLAWQATRQVEVCLALFNISWALQVHWYGSGYQHVIPITASSCVLVVASVLQLHGLLRDGSTLRRVALFVESMVWSSLVLSLLVIRGELAFTYAVLGLMSIWSYLVLSQNKASVGMDDSGTWKQR